MTWKLKGTYIGSCACAQICPCSVDGKPTTKTGECDGAFVAQINEGNLDGVKLSGVTVGVYIHLPSNFSSGNIKMGLVVDEAATEEQAKALERIFSGQEGGMFADFVPLIAEVAQTERAPLKLQGNTVNLGKDTISFEPILGPDGSATTVKNTPFGFVPEFKIGQTSGTKIKTPFASFDPSFGEQADFEWA